MLPLNVQSQRWIIWHAENRAIIARAVADASNTENNRQVIIFDVSVLPMYRQRGLGRRLLASIADYASALRRDVLLTQTQRHLPAGAIWMQRIGAAPSVENQSLQLPLADVQRDVLQKWIARGAEQAQEFELRF
jgi:GNAT superfamily N-acetyltransferase